MSQASAHSVVIWFLIPLLTIGVAAFGGNLLGRPRGPRGRCGPTAPGTISGECALGGIHLSAHTPLSRQLRLGKGPAVATQTARLLGTNRGFDAHLSGGGSYEGQCRCAFLLYRQENISERPPRPLGRTVLCRLCNESGGLEVWGPHAHEPTCSVMCIVGT